MSEREAAAMFACMPDEAQEEILELMRALVASHEKEGTA